MVYQLIQVALCLVAAPMFISKGDCSALTDAVDQYESQALDACRNPYPFFRTACSLVSAYFSTNDEAEKHRILCSSLPVINDICSSKCTPTHVCKPACALAKPFIPWIQKDACRWLPDYCTNPSGSDCKFYEECLAAAYPQCTGTSDDYALAYGKKYCDLYGANMNLLSADGQQWVNRVRGCLQRTLANTAIVAYKNSQPYTCKQVSDAAFGSHAECYVTSGACYLSWSDYKAIFKITSGAFGDQPWDYISQGSSTSWSCKATWRDRIVDELTSLPLAVQEKILETLQEIGSDAIDQIKQKIKDTIQTQIEG